MEYFDNVLGEVVDAHKEVTPESGKFIKLEEPESMKEFFSERKEAE